MEPVSVFPGDSPVILGMPHVGTYVPEDIFNRLNETGKALADTDWHIHLLYDGVLDGASVVQANFHRYVIDANRDPSGQSLYPGQNTTGLCPLTDFEGHALYLPGQEPDAAEVEARRQAWHAPYHAAMQRMIDQTLERHGVAILFDCHSIRSEIAFLFDGILPDLNIGTNDGKSCAPVLETDVASIAAQHADSYSWVLNGRFKGGWTTRHYGQPDKHVHAIQLELAQKTHLRSESAPFDFDEARAERLRNTLKPMLGTLDALAPYLPGGKKHG
ncbi:N-formylglutamate deformylase [Pseudooceanicola sp. HF7]|uniref:N-formylglutamate deformylase n=1 Tax=Pseudooceanicola sp. HF7 TaxID=2721560 RepID=UPI0014314FF8|nr:N-formylglutamate deformylase [Pseudooceanicola sp. HF7]NIZ09072.1 N-formylglutamate deformylase [Pseudooceanicola sp. HF7]